MSCRSGLFVASIVPTVAIITLAEANITPSVACIIPTEASSIVTGTNIAKHYDRM
jgi:hypothetical protein